jgi:hypothetical protein
MDTVGFTRPRFSRSGLGYGASDHDDEQDAWTLLAKSKPTMPCKRDYGVSDAEYQAEESLRQPFKKLRTNSRPYAVSSGRLLSGEMEGFRSAGEAALLNLFHSEVPKLLSTSVSDAQVLAQNADDFPSNLSCPVAQKQFHFRNIASGPCEINYVFLCQHENFHEDQKAEAQASTRILCSYFGLCGSVSRGIRRNSQAPEDR